MTNLTIVIPAKYESESLPIVLSQFTDKNYEILVVNSDGKLFEEKKWKFSNTYAYKDQQKLLISDKNTRDYLNLNFQQKKKKQRTVWGSN